MKKIIWVSMFFSFLVTFSTSCVSLSEEEKKFAESGQVTEVKSPGKAMALSILPGVGSLYLASEKDKLSQAKNHTLGGVAMVNWATWPVSILWSVPQAYVDAKRINIQESYYAAQQAKLTKN